MNFYGGSKKLKYSEKREFEVKLRDRSIQTIFPTNWISTSKYNSLNFIPKALLLQFQKYANVYFVLIAVLQSMEEISPLSPVTAILPLVFVIGISIVREGLEDWNRHQADLEANSADSSVMLFDQGKNLKLQWKDITVGDLIIVRQDEAFPCDIVILSTSNVDGIAYMNTASLDGEKSLKPIISLTKTQQLFNPDQCLQKFDGHSIIIKAQKPDPYLSKFEGSIQIGEFKKFLSVDQFLPRGAYLKNTDWIVGVCVYTGLDTKIMMNNINFKQKQSQIDLQTNNIILKILFFQIFLSLISAILYGYAQTNQSKHAYLEIYGNIAMQNFLSFWTFFLLFNTFIPISLTVTIEFVKYFQAMFISYDEDMYNSSRGVGCTVLTSTINEQLGQIEYIFSDKTGTLTCNKMEFKSVIIGSEIYDKQILQSQYLSQNLESSNMMSKSLVFDDLSFKNKISSLNIEKMISDNENLQKIIKNILPDYSQDRIMLQDKIMYEFMMMLSLCHKCIIDKKSTNITYEGMSPDDICLVTQAQKIGFTFLGVQNEIATVKIQNQIRQVQLIQTFEFDSNRKRMSVIIKDGDTYKMYCKGADSIIKQRLVIIIQIKIQYLTFSQSQHQFYQTIIEEQIQQCSKNGFRTLSFAMKIMTEDQVKYMQNQILQIADDEQREQKILDIAENLENDLFQIASTAINDRLQENVPEVIEDLLRANIKVWMLTGDKLETAESIAKSCRLITQKMKLILVKETDSQLLKEQFRYIHDTTKKFYDNCSLIIDGCSLAQILVDDSLSRLFFEISTQCESVICARTSPKQKAQVVMNVKNYLNKICLAIGDGANDVNMIQQAHIGIGIYGSEGMQAVMSSDIAIPEFQCLWRLIFVHGRWSYIRTSKLIIYFFYKNSIFTFAQFINSFNNFYSGQTVFDDWYISFYNLFFTAMPVLFMGIFDQDFNYKKQDKIPNLLLKQIFPKLYYVGQRNTIFYSKNIINWIIKGFIHSLTLFFVINFASDYTQIMNKGLNTDYWCYSTIYITSVYLVKQNIFFKIINSQYLLNQQLIQQTVTIVLILYSSSINSLNLISIVICSVFTYIIYFIMSNYLEMGNVQNVPLQLVQYSQFYLIVIFGVVFLCLIEYTINFYFQMKNQQIQDVFKNMKNLSSMVSSNNQSNNQTSNISLKCPPKLRNNFFAQEQEKDKECKSSSIISIDSNEEAYTKSFHGIQNFETNINSSSNQLDSLKSSDKYLISKNSKSS